MFKVSKHSEKGKPFACNYCTYETARMSPAWACLFSLWLHLATIFVTIKHNVFSNTV